MHLKIGALEFDMTRERARPGFRNPQVVVPVVRTDLVLDADARVDHRFHLAKDTNPRVVASVSRSALRAEGQVIPELKSNEAGNE